MTTAGEAWVEAVRQLGGDGGVAAVAAADLERRYAEAHRRYHTGAHVQAVLRDSAWLSDQLDLGADARAIVALAACAHDVVYDATPGDDEGASAAWAGANLAAAGVAPDAVRRVEELVLRTLTHDDDAADVAAGVLLDADLAVLAAPPDDYARYVAAVRTEYAAVPEEQWRAGRGAVLSGLLARDPLYLTAPARRRWEDRARRNVQAELAGLREV